MQAMLKQDEIIAVHCSLAFLCGWFFFSFGGGAGVEGGEGCGGRWAGHCEGWTDAFLETVYIVHKLIFVISHSQLF